jgi:hypothetical protein
MGRFAERMSEQSIKPKKIKTAFSETLALSRPALALLLQAYRIAEDEGVPNLSEELIRQRTGLGPNHIKAQKQYARGCGLADGINYLTALGKVLLAYDPDLRSIDTQWLLHYHFVVPHGVGPDFWRYLTAHTLTTGGITNNRAITNQIDQFHSGAGLDRLGESSYNSAATAFLGTYSNSDGLGALSLLRKQDDVYQVGLPEPISINAFTYVLADYWAAQWGDTQTVSLSRITGEAGLAPLLLLGSGETNEILGELHTQGLVRVERSVRPYTVYRLWRRPEEMRERLYAHG